jgi:hypothetical protein
MRAAFDWEEGLNNVLIRYYVNGNIAAQAYLNSLNIYSCVVYGYGDCGWKYFKTLNDAQKHCDDILADAGVKVLDAQYRILL